MMPHKKILCLDFDGVIHSYKSGWKGADVIPDPPVENALTFIRFAVLRFDVQIYSSRSKHEGGIPAMKQWLRDNKLEGLIIDEISFPTQKPPAFVTIDDRAMCFKGVFPSMEEIENFKPWYYK